MRVCPHCKHEYQGKRSGRQVCPACNKASGTQFVCGVCGDTFFAPPSSERKFCSRKCSKIGKKGPERHGESGTRLHGIWCGMNRRCRAKKGYLHKYYSGRGIRVCQEWQDSYEAFRDWALGNGYRDDLELDRINNCRGYCPGNCRWATRHQQMRNTRVRNDPRKTSRYRGVARLPNGRFRAQGQAGGKPLHLGVFDSEVEAAKAYDKWARKEYGDYCNPNFTHGGVPS